ncbi:MAG: hypothetical protein OXK78_09345 [Caldilineaceae bacterium]|nr:hypothetical protein [Caldilineaceae bacterium]
MADLLYRLQGLYLVVFGDAQPVLLQCCLLRSPSIVLPIPHVDVHPQLEPRAYRRPEAVASASMPISATRRRDNASHENDLQREPTGRRRRR